MRDLSGITEEEWRHLDIHLFIAANSDRYYRLTIRKIGSKHLPGDILDILPGMFLDIAYRPLRAVHEKNLNATGDKRNQIMLGTLKMIALTRMVEAVIDECPLYHYLEDDDDWETVLGGQREFDQHSTRGDDGAEDTREEIGDVYSTGGDLAAFSSEHMLEWLRGFLPRTQYTLLREQICEGHDFADLAKRHGTTLTNVRVVMLNARKRLLELMPEEIARQHAHLRFRRPSS
jgi:hypothetical protein